MYGTHIEQIPSLQDLNLRAGLFDSVFYASPVFLFFTNEQNLCRSSFWLVCLAFPLLLRSQFSNNIHNLLLSYQLISCVFILLQAINGRESWGHQGFLWLLKLCILTWCIFSAPAPAPTIALLSPPTPPPPLLLKWPPRRRKIVTKYLSI